MKSEFLGVKATARLLDKSENTIRVWERKGRIVAIKTEGGTRIFKRAEIEQMARRLRHGVADLQTAQGGGDS